LNGLLSLLINYQLLGACEANNATACRQTVTVTYLL